MGPRQNSCILCAQRPEACRATGLLAHAVVTVQCNVENNQKLAVLYVDAAKNDYYYCANGKVMEMDSSHGTRRHAQSEDVRKIDVDSLSCARAARHCVWLFIEEGTVILEERVSFGCRRVKAHSLDEVDR
jgi:hypothetical protein